MLAKASHWSHQPSLQIMGHNIAKQDEEIKKERICYFFVEAFSFLYTRVRASHELGGFERVFGKALANKN